MTSQAESLTREAAAPRLGLLPLWAPDLIACVSLLVLVVVLWLPFDPNITPTNDGWAAVNYFSSAHALTGFQFDTTRPFYFWPWALAGWLTPDSFIGHQVVFASLLFLRGLTTYALLGMVLPRQPAWALASAMLSLLHPADTGIFWSGALNTHAHVMTALLALFFLARFWRVPSRSNGVLAVCAEAIAVWSYESYFPLLLLAPLLLLGLEPPFGRIRLRRVITLWYPLPLLYTMQKMYVILSDSPGTRPEQILDLDLPEIVNSLGRVYNRVYVAGWREAWSSLFSRPHDWYLIIAFMVVSVGGWLLLEVGRDRGRSPSPDVRRIVMLLIGSIVSVGVTFFPYSLTTIRYHTNRTLLLPSLAATLTLTILTTLLPRRHPSLGRVLGLSLTALILALSMASSLRAHAARVTSSHQQQRLLSRLAAFAPGLEPHTVILFLAESPSPAKELAPFLGRHGVGTNAIRYLYDDPSLWFLSFPGHSAGGEAIRVEAQEVVAQSPNRTRRFPLTWAIALVYTKDLRLEWLPQIPSEDPEEVGATPPSRILSQSSLPRRACTMFAIEFRPRACLSGP